MKVPLLDLKKQYKQIKDEVMLTVENVFESQYFILGPNVKELEDKVAEYCGSKYAVGVSSGSDALLISLMVEGIKAGDIIYKVDGTPTREITIGETVKKIKGPKGTSVILTILRKGSSKPIDFKI